MKFGGSSVESAEAIRRVCGLVAERAPLDPIVVVSAMGKTTNRLLECAQLAADGHKREALQRAAELRAYHEQEALPLVSDADRLALETELDERFHELEEWLGGFAALREITPRAWDALASLGERVSSKVVAAALRAQGLTACHVDARRVIITNNKHTQATPLPDEIAIRAAEVFVPGCGISVLGGFIGSTPEGVTTTLGRGGSDFTASLIGAAVGAAEIQIWTDVDGMLTADPRIFAGGHLVRAMSFDEAAEVATFGAKVLHPATVLPAIERNIPVLILNSRNPQAPGTRITNTVVASKNVIKSIAAKRGVTVLNVQTSRMLGAAGFLQRIFDICGKHETSVDMVATSEVSVSLTLDGTPRLEALCSELAQFAEVVVEQNLAIVCLVGDGLRETAGTLGRAFRAVGEINVRMVSQGASQRNLGFVINDADLPAAVERLHAEFFQELDPAVFA